LTDKNDFYDLEHTANVDERNENPMLLDSMTRIFDQDF